jgi:hypothetical protein
MSCIKPLPVHVNFFIRFSANISFVELTNTAEPTTENNQSS